MGAACANAKMNQTVPIIKINKEDENEKKQEVQQAQQKSTSSRDQNLTKASSLSKQVSNISSDGMPPKRTSLSKQPTYEDKEKKLKSQGKNPGLEQLLKQREFILEKFLNDIQFQDKQQLMADVIQMLKIFLSHLEQSNIYWTKVWLINKNDYSIVVGFTNNIGESRKIRIIYTKQIELVSNLLDNYFQFQQFNSYKIFEYSFRLNKKHNNFYIFSEQEYCELCLDVVQIQPEDIKPLLEYLIITIQQMHSQYYIHSGIKPSNVYMNYNKQLNFKLDVSFSALKFIRRNFKNKIKDFRANQVNDLEDIAILIVNSFFKGTDVRQQLKSKNIDFSNLIDQLYQKQKNSIEYYIKEIIKLLHRNKQYLYDLKASDYLSFIKSESNFQLKQVLSDYNFNQNQNNNQKIVLYEYNNNSVVFYNLTQIRNQKCYTQYELIDQEGEQINIIPGSGYTQNNKFYFAYQNMIGMINIKLSTEQIEDTLEMLQISLRQYLAAREHMKKERIDSASKNIQVQLQINNHSPTQYTDDQFKFKDTTQAQKYPNKNFHDRIYFTRQNLYEIYNTIDSELRNYITAQQFHEFLQQQTESIDNTLLQQLLFDKIEEIVYFFSDKYLTFNEFLQIFSFRSKQQLPIYTKIVKPLKQVQNIQKFAILNNSVHYFDGQNLINDENSTEINFELKHMFNHSNCLLLVGKKDGFLYITNMQSSIQTDIQLNQDFGFTIQYDFYLITQQNELIIYSIKQNKYVRLNINGINSNCNLIYDKYFILYMKGQNVYRIFLSQEKWCLTQFNIFDVLFEHGRLDQKIKLKQINNKQNSQISDETVGNYQIVKVLYPITNQVPSLFRILNVIKDQSNYVLIQRIVHAEFESFDDCYQVCKYLDSELIDFFLTMEQVDGRLRLNYVIQNCDLIEKKNCNFTLIKRCVKKLNELRQHDIFVQDMHPNNIFITSNLNIFFSSLIYKTNIPSLFQEKQVPFMSQLEYMEPKSFLAYTQNLTQNKVFINPNKANVYNLGLILLRILSSYQIKNTKEQEFYLMEINLALQQFPIYSVKPIIEEMLKDNEEQRFDSYQLIQFIRKYEKQNLKEIYLISPQLQLLEIQQQQQVLYGYLDNSIYSYNQVFQIFQNVLSNKIEVLTVLSNDESQLILLVKIKTQKVLRYNLIYIQLVDDQNGFTLKKQQTQNFDELINFQKYAENEDEEQDDQQNHNQQLQIIQTNYQYIQLPHQVIQDITVPIFDIQNIDNCPCLLNVDQLYFFGFGIKNEIKRVGSRDCFVYLQKRNLFKKIGYRTSYYDCQVIDYGEQCFLLENQPIENKIRIQIIIKSPFDCQERTIKLISNEKLFFVKLQQNIFALSKNQSWLINIETFKALQIQFENLPHQILSMQNTQNSTILTQTGVSTLQFDGNILKVY